MIRPAKNKVLIAPIESPANSDGGIIIPDAARSKTQEGYVVEIGASDINIGIQKGERVFVEMWKGVDIEFGGKQYRLVEIKDIIGAGRRDSSGHTFYAPVGNRILLKPLPKVESSSIIRPSAYEADETEIVHCHVHLLGHGNRTKKGVIYPFNVKVGDKVAISGTMGRDVMAGDGVYKLVEERDILAVIGESKL